MPDTNPIRILYAEDDPAAARLLQRRLQRLGYEVDTASQGEEALQMCRTGSYDLLALDHDMPLMSGLDVIRELSEQHETPPIIMITGAGNEAVAVEAMKLGAEDYLIKDTATRYLELVPTRIEQALGKRRLIAEKKHAEERLKLSERLLSDTFAGIQDGLSIVDEDFTIIRVNPALEKWFAFAMPLVGKKCHEAYYRQSAPCEDCPAVKTLRNGRAHVDVRPKYDREGLEAGWLELHSWPLVDQPTGKVTGVIKYIRDITDRRRAEQALKASEDRYRRLFEDSPVALWYEDWSEAKLFLDDLTASGVSDIESHFEAHPELLEECVRKIRLIDANRAATEMFRAADKAELLECGHEIFCDETYEALNEGLRFLANGRSSLHSETVLRKLTGERMTVALRLFIPPDGRESLSKVLCSGIDITERKRTQDLLLKSERLKAVGELAGGVSHNFNNMLQIVLGNAQLAMLSLENSDTESVGSHLDQILRTSKLASQTVKRLQHFARSGEFMTSESVFDLSAIVNQAVEMSGIWWKSEPERDGINIRMSRSLEPGCLVSGRESDMIEVVVNLIRNAAEALVDGGEIKVETTLNDETVELRISDTGPGVEKHELVRIFEPFFTTKGLTRPGMGLASAYGLAKAHGGDIFADNLPGGGAVFTLVLPRSDTPAKPARSGAERPSTRTFTILVVDDLASVLTTLRNGLLTYGHRVLTASSGGEALDILTRMSVDAIVCDLGMPGMNGWEVGRAITKTCEETDKPKPAFILLSGWNVEDQTEDKADAGVDRIVRKPVEIEELIGIIESTIAGAADRSSN